MLDTGAKTSSTAAVGRLSIHAPAWGATYTSAPSVALVGFQSTLPRGERHEFQISVSIGRSVSIHAPAWGATGVGVEPTLSRVCFNPRSRVGSDQLPCVPRHSMPFKALFQSTLPRGERPGTIHRLDNNALRVSIHAPAWGATNTHR